MQSSFAFKANTPMATSKPQIEETYDLKGINLISPDQIMPKGESPYTINSRMFAREDSESRVANRTRKGSSLLSTPVGQTANISNVATASGDIPFSPTVIIAQPFTANADGDLTKLELELKKLDKPSGHIIIEIRNNASSFPGTLIAQSSINSSLITGSYQYLPAYFIDAPSLVNATKYWMVVYTQDNGAGTYALHQTVASGALQKVHSTTEEVWTVLGVTFRYKTYTSTHLPIKGFGTRYPSSGAKLMLMAQGTTVYAVPKGTGVPTAIDTTLDSAATHVRFLQIDDGNYWATGKDPVRVTTNGTSSADITGIAGTPTNLLLAHNRLFLMTGSTRVDFSELSDFTTWPSDNFFYVPTALSPDPMTAWCFFKGDIWIFTKETKHRITGTDITSFTRRELTGTKGCVGQEALAVDNDFMYFMSDDKQIYRSNGVGDDQLISDKVQPELQSIQDTGSVRLHLYRNQLRVYYPKSPSTVPSRMLLYDIAFKQWFLDTGRPVVGSMELYLDSNELVEFSSVVGAIYYGESGYSDLGKEIDWKFWTRYNTYGSGSAKKRIKRFRPVMRTVDANYTMSVGKDLDFNNTPDMRAYSVQGGGAKWGAFVWGDGTKWGSKKLIDSAAAMSGRGRYVQYRFERSGVETPAELYGYISQFKTGAPK